MTETQKAERLEMAKAMEFIAQRIDSESVFNSWRMNGVTETDGKYEEYCTEDDVFSALMTTFLRVMNRTRKSGGLSCGGVTSAVKPADETPFCHVCWNNDDLREILTASGIPPTSDNVWALRNELEYGRHRIADDMIEAGWSTAQNAIDFLRKENALKA